MKQRTKKIIAREFLILTSLLIVVVIFCLVWIFSVNINQKSIIKLNNNNNKLEKSILKPQRNIELTSPIKALFDRAKDSFAYKKDLLEFYDSLSKDSLLVQQNFTYVKTKGYTKKLTDFKKLLKLDSVSLEKHQFIKRKNKDVLTKNSKINKEIIANNNKIKHLEKSIFNSDNSNETIIMYAIYIIGFIYTFRFLFMSVQWSIKQIRD